MAAKSITDEEFSNEEEVGGEQDVEEAQDEDYDMSEHENGDKEGSNEHPGEENKEETRKHAEGKEENRAKSNKMGTPSGAHNRSKSINDAFNTRYIWVNNIPPGTVRRQLEDLFEKYATVAAIKIIRGTGDTLLGFVKLEDAKHTRKCYEKLNKFEFRGFKLELSKDRPNVPRNQVERNGPQRFRHIRPDHSYRSPGSYRHEPHNSARDYTRGYSPRRSSNRYEEDRLRTKLAEDRLKIEREKIEVEKLKIERDRLELLKLRASYDVQQQQQQLQRAKLHEEKSHRTLEPEYIGEKRSYWTRHEEFAGRKVESSRKGGFSPSRQVALPRSSYGNRSRYEDNGSGNGSRGSDRYAESGGMYRSAPISRSSNSWQTTSSSTNDQRYHSSSYMSSGASRPISGVMNNSGSSSSRLHHSDAGGNNNFSSREYYMSKRY